MLLNYHNNHPALQSKVSKHITGSNEITHTRALCWRRGSLLLLLTVIKPCFQTQNFIARTKRTSVSIYFTASYGSCHGFVIAFLMLHILAKVLRLLVITRDSAFIYKKQNENNPQKKAVFVDLKFEICSVYPKPEGKWKQQKCIFFLCFRNSHSLGEMQFLLGGWIRLSVCVWAPALHCWHEVSWLGQSPDLCAGEAAPRDISRSCTSLMAELRRESRS